MTVASEQDSYRCASEQCGHLWRQHYDGACQECGCQQFRMPRPRTTCPHCSTDDSNDYLGHGRYLCNTCSLTYEVTR